jgi:hypothetical protein
MEKIISIERLTGMTCLVVFDNGKSYTYSNRELVAEISNENISLENAHKIYYYFISNKRFSRPLTIEAKTRWTIREALAKNK